VNPLELQRQMRMIIDNPTLCTEVLVTAILPKGFTFSSISEDKRNHILRKGSTVERDIGNVTSDSDITYEYTVSSKEAAAKFVKSNQVPIQFLLEYTKKDKSKYVKVINERSKITSDRAACESCCNVSVVSLNAVQQSARIAQDQNYSLARNKLLSVQRMLARCCKTDIQQEEYSNFITMCEDLDTALLNMQKKGGKTDDQTAKVLHRMKTINKVTFLAGAKKEEIVAKRKKHTNKQTTKN